MDKVDASENPGWRRVERWLIRAIALHSYGVGIALLAVPRWAASLGGWEHVEPLFFARQAGVFHLLLATFYLVEHHRAGTVRILLVAKATAVVFLTTAWLAGPAPWLVPFSAVTDGLMGLAVLGVRRAAAAGLSPPAAGPPH